jgi:hypothetical protein
MTLSLKTVEGRQAKAAGKAMRRGNSIAQQAPNRGTADDALTSPTDCRESLANDQRSGPVTDVSLPEERITSLHGIMVDLDPKLLVPENPVFPPDDDPEAFLERISPVLDRHPLARHAEIRSSGTGLHLIIWLEQPVELQSTAEQKYWSGMVKVVQASLPSDPNAPGITALTRPVGSINSKNQAGVRILREGVPVAHQQVIDFVTELAATPFKGVARVLFGTEHVTPCPICSAEGSRLAALEHAGRCYHCGTVHLDTLMSVVVQEAKPVTKTRTTRRAGRNECREQSAKMAGRGKSKQGA